MGIAEVLRAHADAGAYDTAIEIAHEALARRELPETPRLSVTLALAKILAVKGCDAEAISTFEEVLEQARAAGSSEFAADALDWLSWLAWTNLDGERARSMGQQMMTLAVPATSSEAFRLFVRKATQLVQLGDAPAAATILKEAEHVSRDADIDSFSAYLSIKADVLSGLARPDEALSYARLAADIATQRSDRYLRWRRLLYLGYNLHANGRLAEAYDTYEAAETLAGEAALTWEVPLTRARAAWEALLLGRVTLARDRINACFGPACSQPQRWMTATRCWVGIMVGLAAGDEELVARAVDGELLERVLSSDDYYSIGPMLAAFIAYYVHKGQRSKASALLELGISSLPSADCGWALLPAVARYGSDHAVARAHALLERFPREHRIAEAHRQFFLALLTARHGQPIESERRAGEAQLLFDDFGCELYVAECLEAAGRLAEAHSRYVAMGAAGKAAGIAHARRRRGRPRRGYEASRERREILRLLLKGLTSSSIADRLAVCERTIKNRISEIYDFEGVRNRAELFERYRVARR